MHTFLSADQIIHKIMHMKKLRITMDIQEVVSMKGIIDPINKYTQVVFWINVDWLFATKFIHTK